MTAKKKRKKSKKPSNPSKQSPKTPKKEVLSPKQVAFCERYLIHFNASKAAQEAGYSKKTAGSQAHDLLKKPEIQAKIKTLRDEASERNKLDKDWVLQRLMAIADTPIMDFINLTPSGAIPREDLDKMDHFKKLALGSVTYSTSETQFGETTRFKINVESKTAALQQLGNHLGMFNDNDDDGGQKDDQRGGLGRLPELLKRLKK